ncbi:monovalent cation/H+ antiporter subunit D [Puniceibacterium sediminis]|uniref:Multisubunit potassium/proton antiporter, PhaD subunit n=1 Tax=Puniceibacterium sediminis TaxID=1608407 RepID=A0A238WXX3_9RHOB|nr:monovalent cation/H+ antiporter subunit D [Puniceibacterium sediminis]SNR50449.1 multisubunit potassium/proton antiporter, PhaD subunit [Puniceibacterium sediminis]
MTHWIIAPIVLPAMLAAFIVLVVRFHQSLARAFSLAGVVMLMIIASGLAWQASDGTIGMYQLGNWAAPFGIVLVADRLSTMMVLLTSVLALFVLLYAIGSGWDKRGQHFHALFQFQMMGIMGAFLTGDIFNLFVFFEVLLIASYGLMIHSGGTRRLRAGTQYVLYNLLGSTLFLFALGAIYAETGTLNMADLAVRVAEIAPDNSTGIRVAAVLLLMVFAIKAAIAPLHFWLPSSYAEAPAPVAALFGIMTKVGAYAIIRIYTLVFPPDLEATAGLFGMWLLPVALVGLAVGMVGVLGTNKLDRLIAFAVIGSMGMLTTAVALFTPAGISAALYYVIHSTLATAALFLIADLVRSGRGAAGLDLRAAPPIAGGAIIAPLFFVAAIAMTGLPPLSGFVGKLLILDASFGTPLVWVTWAVILGSSLIAVVGFSRAGSVVFWKSHQLAAEAVDETTPEDAQGALEPHDPKGHIPVLEVVAIAGLLALLVVHTVLAGPVTRYMDATTAQLFTPEPYIRAVLDVPGKDLSKDPHHADEGHAEDPTEGGHDAAEPEGGH